MNRIQRYFLRKKRKKQLYTPTPQKVRRYINMHFENEAIQRSLMEITDIKVKKKKFFLEITITLVRPGLLIGKGGRTIDGLKKYLEKLLDVFVEIKVKESKLWH